MAGPYVTGSAILAHVRQSDPTADDTEWADVVAAAIESSITLALADVTTDTDQDALLARAALQDGAAGYVDRKAPHGVLTIGPDGDVTRLGRDLWRALVPVMARLSPGIG